jgi:hypothetical protein
MRADAALILVSLGFKPDIDFIAVNGTPTSCDIVALNGATLPSEAEIDAAAPNTAANLLAIEHAKLVSMLSNGPDHAKLLRALLLIVLDEFNLHAEKINAILTAIDSGSTLAQVKTNIAAIADYPTRTKANLITAMTNKINAGDADT